MEWEEFFILMGYSKLTLMSHYYFLLFLFYCCHTHAQTKVWGHQAPVGQAAGEFQAAFVPSTVASSYAPNHWTALSISDSSNYRVPGAAFWTQTTLGRSQGAYHSNVQIASTTTFANGAAIFDSDYLDNVGVMWAFGTGTSPAAQKGALISPRIDLSAVADSALILSFYSFYRYFELEELSVALSKDDGITWEPSFDIAALQPTLQNQFIQGRLRILLDSFTLGGVNLTQCRLKFTFEGEYYFAMLDDVTLEVAPSYDMAIGHADPTASTLEERGNIIRMGGNAYQSYGNIDFVSPVNWSWGAKVVNYGGKPILPSQRPRLYCRVEVTDLLMGTTNSTNYLDSIVYGDTLFSGVEQEIILKENMDYTDMMNLISNSTSQRALEFTVYYWTAQDGGEVITNNDTTSYSFIIRDNPNVPSWFSSTNMYTSKVEHAPVDDRVKATEAIFPAGGPYKSLEYGSVYYFPYGAFNQIVIDSLDFRYYLTNNYSGADTQIVFANIYEYEDRSNGGAADGNIQSSELTQIGISVATLTGLGTTIGGGSYHLTTFSPFVDAATGAPLGPLRKNGFYFISVQIAPHFTGGIDYFGIQDVPLHGTDVINYSLNSHYTTNTAPSVPATMVLTDTFNNIIFETGANYVNKVPSLGVYYSYQYINTKQLDNQVQVHLTLSPNPTTNTLQVNTNLAPETKIQYIITEATGRVVYYTTQQQISKGIFTIPVQHLAAGTYFLTIQTPEGSQTATFVKQ